MTQFQTLVSIPAVSNPQTAASIKSARAALQINMAALGAMDGKTLVAISVACLIHEVGAASNPDYRLASQHTQLIADTNLFCQGISRTVQDGTKNLLLARAAIDFSNALAADGATSTNPRTLLGEVKDLVLLGEPELHKISLFLRFRIGG